MVSSLKSLIVFFDIAFIFPFRQVSRVAQWKRAGPITQRSVDRNHSLLSLLYFCIGFFSFTIFFISISNAKVSNNN